MTRHATAVFRKFFLLAEHPDDHRADAQLRTYIKWYEWAARTGWFVAISLAGLGLGSASQLTESALQTISSLRNGSVELSAALSKLAAPLLSNPLGIVLAVVIIGWHHSYLRHVKNETDIVESCFEKDQKPEWQEVSGAKFAPLIGVWLFIAFSAMCLSVGRIKWCAVVALVLNLGDFAGNEFVKKNLLKAFRSKSFRTRDKTLLARREIALDYWVEKMQLTRVLVMFVTNVVALMLASDVFGVHVPDAIAYALVALGIVMNEYIITTWRIERDNELAKFPVSAGGQEQEFADDRQPAAAPARRPKRKRTKRAGPDGPSPNP